MIPSPPLTGTSSLPTTFLTLVTIDSAPDHTPPVSSETVEQPVPEPPAVPPSNTGPKPSLSPRSSCTYTISAHCGGLFCDIDNDCHIGFTCHERVCVATATSTSVTETSMDAPSLIISTLFPASTSTVGAQITNPTLSQTINTSTWAPPTSTAPPEQPIPALSPPASNHKLVYLAIPFALLAFAILCIFSCMRQRKKHASRIILDAAPTAQVQPTLNNGWVNPPAFGTNKGNWTRGHRDYRNSAVPTVSRVGNLRLPAIVANP